MTRRLLLSLAVLLIGFTSVMLWMTRGSEPETIAQSGTLEGSPAASAPAAIGGAFTLTDQNGKAVSDTEFRGRLMLVFFGFTHCPDVCPVAMATITNVMNQLGDDGKRVVPVFITVDPERDTPQRMKTFMADFHPSIVALTGSKEQLDAVAKEYKVYAAKQHDQAHADGTAHHEGDYQMDHSAFIYLMDKQGAYVTHFAQGADEKAMIAAIRAQLP